MKGLIKLFIKQLNDRMVDPHGDPDTLLKELEGLGIGFNKEDSTWYYKE